MRRYVLAALVLAAVPSPSSAAPCVPATLSAYMGLAAGCTVGGALFSDFSSGAAPGADIIDGATIVVSPVADASGVGLSFDFNVLAEAGEVFGTAIGYRVSGLTFTSRSLSLEGQISSRGPLGGTSVSPDGVITALQFAPDPLIVFDNGIDQELLATGALPGTSVLDVLTEITVDGGLAGRAALNGSVVQQYGVPEPASVGLLGVALGAVVWRRRRTRP